MLILISKLAGCVSVSAFASLVCVPVGISSSAVGWKICAITAEIKKYKSIIRKKKKKKHDIIVLLGKYKLDIIEVLLCKALTVAVDSMLREYNDTKEVMKSPEISVGYNI